jgi:hypothetical protein
MGDSDIASLGQLAVQITVFIGMILEAMGGSTRTLTQSRHWLAGCVPGSMSQTATHYKVCGNPVSVFHRHDSSQILPKHQLTELRRSMRY